MSSTPYRFSISSGSMNARYTDDVLANPFGWVWRDLEYIDRLMLSWLDANARGWTTEVDLGEPCEDSGLTIRPFESFVCLPSPEQRDDFAKWHGEQIAACAERAARAAPGQPTCFFCGMPLERGLRWTSFRIGEVLVHIQKHGQWCDLCEDGGFFSDRDSDTYFILARKIRAWLGIPAGAAGIEEFRRRSSGEPAFSIVAHDDLTEEEFTAAMARGGAHVPS